MRVPKSLHRRLAERAKAEGVSLNTLAVSLLSEGIGARQHRKSDERNSWRLSVRAPGRAAPALAWRPEYSLTSFGDRLARFSAVPSPFDRLRVRLRQAPFDRLRVRSGCGGFPVYLI